MILVDPEDAWLLTDYRWHITSHGYVAMRLHKHLCERRTLVYLHHAIMGWPMWAGWEWDHINRQPTDNRRCNLRLVTHASNLANNSQRTGVTGARGVTPLPNGRFMAQVKRQGVNNYLGSFDTVEEASAARDRFLAEINYLT